MSQVSFTSLVPLAPENVNTLNAILAALQAGINSVDSTQLATGSVTPAALTTTTSNTFLKLATVANSKIAWGVTAAGGLNSVASRSQVSATVAHGLGTTPVVVVACGLNTVAITEDGGAIPHPITVATSSYGATTFAALCGVNGTSNNAASFVWVAIG